MLIRENILPLSIFIAATAIMVSIRVTTHPSLTRAWEPNQALLASIDFRGDEISIRNIRNTQYRTANDYVPTYFDRTFRLSELRRACLIKEDLDGFGNAHLMLTFQFPGPEWVVFSPEPRLERGESFSPLLGLFRRYELAYIVTTETDAIYERTKILDHPVYIYDLQLDEGRLRTLFTSVAEREAELAHVPEFYHSIFNSVSSNIMRHLRTAQSRWRSGLPVLPSNVDRMAYEMRILRRDVTLELLMGTGMITDIARASEPNADFSEKIHARPSQIQEGL